MHVVTEALDAYFLRDEVTQDYGGYGDLLDGPIDERTASEAEWRLFLRADLEAEGV